MTSPFATMFAIIIFCFLPSLSHALDFCGVRCDIDAQCGGDCERCVDTAENERICLAQIPCGGRCRVDSDCGPLCTRCRDNVCGGLPCHAECNNNVSMWCGDECPACMPLSVDVNRTVCTQPCGLPCNSSLACASPCSRCSDGACLPDPVLSVGAVVGITIAVSLVGGAICVPLLVVFFYALANWSDEMDDEDPSFAFILVGLLSIPFGVAIFALAVGLPLGLSPSVCCS